MLGRAWPHHMCGGQRTTSPSTFVWVLRTELGVRLVQRAPLFAESPLRPRMTSSRKYICGGIDEQEQSSHGQLDLPFIDNAISFY